MPSQFFRKSGPINPRAPAPNLPSIVHLIETIQPSHIPISTSTKPSPSGPFNPKHSSIPKSEMTKMQRHTAHLRKKRVMKRDKKKDEGELIRMAAKGDKRALRTVEERKANKTLQGNKNVSFIQNGRNGNKSNVVDRENDKRKVLGDRKNNKWE